MDTTWTIGMGAVLALLLLLLLFVRIRQRKAEDEPIVVREEPPFEAPAMAAEDRVEGTAAATAEPPTPQVEAEAAPELAVDAEPEREPEPAPELELDPTFVAARSSLDKELMAGHFSRLDVFEGYQHASKKAYGHIGPRSEYFHRIVNQAIGVRDAFETLLCDEDRERFVGVHSRYLDDVSVETDETARDRMHREQSELLQQLRPKPIVESTAA